MVDSAQKVTITPSGIVTMGLTFSRMETVRILRLAPCKSIHIFDKESPGTLSDECVSP